MKEVSKKTDMLKIESRLETWLPTQPEYRMGYQKVDLIFKNGRFLKGIIILNAEDCQTETDFNVEDIAEIKIHKG